MKKALLSALPSVEPLEARIAPATLTFVDIDGDQVTITTSKGSDADLAAVVNPFLIDSGAGKLLQKIDLASNAVFEGTNLTITAEVVGAGDGLVDIGYIHATGLDLGRVTVDGDLGQIDSGNSKLSTPGLKSLEVGSLGARGTTTQHPAEASLISNIQGPLSSLIVSGDVHGTLDVSGGAKTSAGRIGKIEIGGSLIGGTQQLSGSISASGAIGTISIQSLLGGTAANTGYIGAASINSLIVEKSITGGDGEFSGAVQTRGDIKSVEIGEDIVGGLATTAHDSGEIRANGTLKSVVVLGKVQGGGGTHSGAITSGQGIGTIQIDNGLIGGGGFESGTVGTKGTIQKVTIGGELTGGGGSRSGAVLATAKISNVTVNGDVTGGNGNNSGVIGTDGGLVQVTINGNLKGGAGSESGAIGSTKTLTSVHITGNLEGGDGIRSGVVVSSTSIESVIIDGSVRGGTNSESGSIGSFGPVKLVKIGGDLQGNEGYRSGAILSAIALGKIEIGGSLIGGASNDSGLISTFGVISSVTIGNNLEGGGSYRSGLIEGNRVNNVQIGGDVFGGGEWLTGSIVAAEFRFEMPGFVKGPSSTGPEPLLGTITVRGNVYGGNGSDSGSFISDGAITSITIGTPIVIIDKEVPRVPSFGGGSLHGGSGYESGSILARGNIGVVTIFGDLIGGEQFGEGSPYNSGGIAAGGNIQKVFIGRDLRGGDSSYRDFSEGGISGPGQIYARGRIGTVDIGGSVIGSYGEHSATIWSGALGRIKVMGSVFAGPGEYSASFVAAEQDIQELRIVGELTNVLTDPQFEGREPGFRAASIAAARTLGQVDIGTIYGDTSTPVMITAGGKIGARNDTEARAIGTLVVHNSSSFADILAGYDIFGDAVNPDAQIGTVTVGNPNPEGGEPSFAWESTNVVAGVIRGFDGVFGTSDDLLITNPDASSKVISKIARVIINGFVASGEQESITQGIVAEQIGAVFLQGDKASLHAGPHNDVSVTFPFEPSLGINEPRNTLPPTLQD